MMVPQAPSALAAVTAAVPTTGGEARWFLGELAVIKLTGGMTGGRLALVEFSGPQGSETPPHVHSREDEVFILEDGEMMLTVGNETIDVKRGDVVLAPKSLPHGYVVRSPHARWLVLTFPAGFEDFVREASAPARELRIPKPEEPQGDAAALVEIAEKHGIRFG